VGSYVKTFDSWEAIPTQERQPDGPPSVQLWYTMVNVGLSQKITPDIPMMIDDNTLARIMAIGYLASGQDFIFSTLWDDLPTGCKVTGVTLHTARVMTNTGTNNFHVFTKGAYFYVANLNLYVGAADLIDDRTVPPGAAVIRYDVVIPSDAYTVGETLVISCGFSRVNPGYYGYLSHLYLEVTYEEPSGVKAYHGTEKVDVLYHWKQNVTALY
jgi:hypothetical protein